jgi:hypothetical protein
VDEGESVVGLGAGEEEGVGIADEEEFGGNGEGGEGWGEILKIHGVVLMGAGVWRW